MKRITSFVIMMVIVMGLLPTAHAAEQPWQSWTPEWDYNTDLYGYKSGGEWVIEPQYNYANGFDGSGYAW